jgi:hypothetical protein
MNRFMFRYSLSQKDEVCRGMLQPLQCQAFPGKIGTSPFRERLYGCQILYLLGYSYVAHDLLI